jgi:ABC-type transport system involved in cytochrome c biogenesis permease subunit
MRTAAASLERPYRLRWAPLLCLAILLVDQASKAVQPAGRFVVNTGGAAILPASLGDILWKSQTLGAACDTADAVILLAALRMTRSLADTRQQVAATAVLAGLLSNLVDRLGGSSVFHAGLPRGSIDWIPVPPWPTGRTNVADIVIVLGVLVFTYRPARRTIHAIQALARRSRAARLATAAAGLIAIAIWATVWQANRHAADLRTTARSETTERCVATSHAGDGMDWLSYRPTAGPVPYQPSAPRDAIPGCR